MPFVKVRENEPFEVALRRFKRSVEKAGIPKELRMRQFYEKPTQERKRKRAASVKRHMKRARPPQSIHHPTSFSNLWMTIKEKIQEEIKEALRAGEKTRLMTLRLLLAAIKEKEIEKQKQLEEAEILAIIAKMIKDRQESIRQFTAGNRPELAMKEEQEIGVLQSYLPAQLDEKALLEAIDLAMQEVGALTIKDMGKVMALLTTRLQGRADMKAVSTIVRKRLQPEQ